jgi:hypothetical protein
MDQAKCQALKEKLSAQPEPQIVSIEEFFDGNDDLGSIGCNLDQHPGVEAFRDVLTGLLRRSDVEAVYAQISELDPGEGSWPFSDTVLVVGRILADELRKTVSALQPDEVDTAATFGVSPAVGERHGSPVLAAWWD